MAVNTTLRPAVFIDRDDTIIDTHLATANQPAGRVGDLLDPALVHLIPGSAAAMRALMNAGFALVIFTSQGGVARGPLHPGEPAPTLRDVEHVNDELRRRLANDGVRLAGVYYCPFHPKGVVPRFTREHDWRKPGPGMVTSAAAELGLDLSRSWAVGDQPRDVQSGIAAGIAPERALLVGTGGVSEAPFADLAAAGAHILSHLLRSTP